MDGISTSRDLQASHGLVALLKSPCTSPKGSLLLRQLSRYTNERSLTKPRGSEPGDTQEQASPVGMPQGAKEVYRLPSALGDWWILNLLLNWLVEKVKYTR